jgi:hypothetical protein
VRFVFCVVKRIREKIKISVFRVSYLIFVVARKESHRTKKVARQDTTTTTTTINHHHGESISGRLESAVRHATRVSALVFDFFFATVSASLSLFLSLSLSLARARRERERGCFFEKMID